MKKEKIQIEEDLALGQKGKKIILEKGDRIQILEKLYEVPNEVQIFMDSKSGKKVKATVSDFHFGISYTHIFTPAMMSYADYTNSLTVLDYNDDSNLFIELSKATKIEGNERRLSIKYSDGSSIFLD